MILLDRAVVKHPFLRPWCSQINLITPVVQQVV